MERLRNLSSEAEDGGSGQRAGAIVLLAFLLPIVEFFGSLAELIGTLFDIPITLITSTIDGFGALILSVVGGAARLISAGAESAARSLLIGIWSTLGPLNYAVAISAALLGFIILFRYLRETETGDSPFTLGTGIDFGAIPIIGDLFGVEEEDEEGDE
jgi:hypothetical protein